MTPSYPRVSITPGRMVFLSQYSVPAEWTLLTFSEIAVDDPRIQGDEDLLEKFEAAAEAGEVLCRQFSVRLTGPRADGVLTANAKVEMALSVEDPDEPDPGSMICSVDNLAPGFSVSPNTHDDISGIWVKGTVGTETLELLFYLTW